MPQTLFFTVTRKESSTTVTTVITVIFLFIVSSARGRCGRACAPATAMRVTEQSRHWKKPSPQFVPVPQSTDHFARRQRGRSRSHFFMVREPRRFLRHRIGKKSSAQSPPDPSYVPRQGHGLLDRWIQHLL